MSKKKKKKAKMHAAADGAPAPETPAPPRRRWPWVAGAAVVAVAAFLAFAATLPGYEEPNEALRRCRRRIERLSTALYRWSRTHGGAFPDGLDPLPDAGLFPEDPALRRCPATGAEYELVRGMRPDMPGGAVLLHCPAGAVHRYRSDRKDERPILLIHYIGADFALHYEGVYEDAGKGTTEETARRKFARRLEEQAEALQAAASAFAGDAVGAAGLRRLAFDPSKLPETRALAAWAMGASGDASFRPDLLRLFASSAAREPDDLGIAVAGALLRLDETRGVPFLIDVLGEADPGRRWAAEDLLAEAFAGDPDPPPDYRAWAPAKHRQASARAWKAWWQARRER